MDDKSIDELRDEREDVIAEIVQIDGWLATHDKWSSNTYERQERRAKIVRKAHLQEKSQKLKRQMQKTASNGKIAAIVTNTLHPADVRRIGELDVKVTDHALVRWMQRKHGIDTDAMKKDMYKEVMSATVGTRAMLACSGNGLKVLGEDGMTYIVDRTSGIILTCYEEGGEEEVREVTDALSNQQSQSQ